MKRLRRGTTNVVATVLIFSIMISSMGVLYSIISPTIFGYQADLKTTNQEFVMLSVSNTVKELSVSAEDSQGRVRIISNEAIYSVNSGQLLTVDVRDSVGSIGSESLNIGSFTANVSNNLQAERGIRFFSSAFDETTFITTNETERESAVIKGDFNEDDARFSLYFRASLFISNQLPDGTFEITITIIQFQFQAGFVDFPVELDEWTLRLRRKPAVITTFTKDPVVGNLGINQNVDGATKIPYNFPLLSGESVIVRFIVIPILFSI